MASSLEQLFELSKDLNVLYVEDDLALQQKSFSMFKNIFNEVNIASNGREALAKYKEYYLNNNKYYDIVISDIKMPKMDGVSLSKKIKHLNDKQIIVITSAHDESKYLIEFINMGIKKFIKKPFTLDIITDIFWDICNDYFNKNINHIIKLKDGYSWNKKEKTLCDDNAKEIKLSYSEIVILDLLLCNPDQIFSNSDFFYTIQSHSFDQELSADSIKSAIKRIRKKLPPETIENIYGQGYRIKKEI
jgi:DNA-binding response OmpR family regulator